MVLEEKHALIWFYIVYKDIPVQLIFVNLTIKIVLIRPKFSKEKSSMFQCILNNFINLSWTV